MYTNRIFHQLGTTTLDRVYLIIIIGARLVSNPPLDIDIILLNKRYKPCGKPHYVVNHLDQNKVVNFMVFLYRFKGYWRRYKIMFLNFH